MMELPARISFLKKLFLFHDVEDEELAIIASRLDEVAIPKDAIIFAQGGKAESFYLIVDGQVSLVREQNGKEIQLAVLTSQEYFGDIELTSNDGRLCTATALTENSLLVLPKTEFQVLILWRKKSTPILLRTKKMFNPSAQKRIEGALYENAKSLDLGALDLMSLPEQIGLLHNIRALNISYNKFVSLPYQIGHLQYLRRLDALINNLEHFPPQIISLTRLNSLNLSLNKIQTLPDEIDKLSNLDHLDLSYNEITNLPNAIGKLSNLTHLNLRGNKLTDLPIGISKLSKLRTLDLRDNPLSIPLEILEKTDKPESILSAYFGEDIANAVSIADFEDLFGGRDGFSAFFREIFERRPLLEAKVLILGQGSVGKTSVVQRILYGAFEANQAKTEGISINQWSVLGRTQEQSIKLNVWDFGGQEIMHATHQFFLTKRSLYLLVLDARLTQEENRVEYWLKIIQSFGADSPVLIVGNKADQHRLDIDRTGLQKKYANVVGIIETSAATGSGIELLKTAIAKHVDGLPHIRDNLPATWFTVKSKLEELAKHKNFFTQEEFISLCETNNVSDATSQRTLIGFLHDLGVVLHFQDDPRLEQLGILNPQWVTNGVYKILNSHELFQNRGILTLSILDRILNLPEYPSSKRLFIVDMMKKFELCYDIEPDKTFLIPDLLPKDEPFLDEWDGALAFQYQYNVLPTSIISRFIVRMNAFAYKTAWRSGVVLKSSWNTALVKADTEERKIYISVKGDENTRRDFLSAIRLEFEAIHKTIVKIETTEEVPHPTYPELILDFEELIEFERQGVNEFPKKVGTQVVICNVRELLDGVRRSRIQATKVFISYGHDDKEFTQKLASELGKQIIEPWWDFDSLKGGHNWQKEIQQGIKLCDFFLVVLTPKSVESEWVTKEIMYANEYKKTIIPLMLKSCERPISIIEKQYIDFEKQTQKAALKQLLEILKDRA
jgi:internalin A